MSRVPVFAVVLCVLVLALAGPVFAVELVTNGGFETGDFTGWTVLDQPGGEGSWYTSSATGTPFSVDGSGNPLPTPGPASGTYYAISDEGNPACSVLYQDIVVPSAGVIDLSFDYFANNWDYLDGGGSYVDPSGLDYTSGGTYNPNQNCRVDLLDPGADPFTTDPTLVLTLYGPGDDGPDLPYGWAHFDGSGGTNAGTLRLRFAFVANDFYFNMGVDNVSVNFTPNGEVPEPSSIFLLLMGLPMLPLLKRRGKAA